MRERNMKRKTKRVSANGVWYPCEAQPQPKKNQVKITNENTNKKREDYERWHQQSRERNHVQGMSM